MTVRRSLLLATALLGGVARVAQPQTSDVSKMFISLFFGVVSGRDFWSIDGQRVARLDAFLDEFAVDTMRIGRRTRPGFAIGVSGTLFKTPHLGISGEFSYQWLQTEDDCQITFLEPPSATAPSATADFNTSFCTSINQRSDIAANANVAVGLLYRIAPGGRTSPYFRVMAGISDRAGTSADISGTFNRLDRPIVIAPGSASIRPAFGGAIGLTVPGSSGYNFTLEFRDQLYLRDIVQGPADALANAPISKEWTHNFALLAGIDIVLEKRRGRRY